MYPALIWGANETVPCRLTLNSARRGVVDFSRTEIPMRRTDPSGLHFHKLCRTFWDGILVLVREHLKTEYWPNTVFPKPSSTLKCYHPPVRNRRAGSVPLSIQASFSDFQLKKNMDVSEIFSFQPHQTLLESVVSFSVHHSFQPSFPPYCSLSLSLPSLPFFLSLSFPVTDLAM